MQSIKKKERNHEMWLKQFDEKSSYRQYKISWDFWTQFIENKNEDWILANLHSEDWGQHLVNFRRWLSQQPKQRGKGTLSDNTTRLHVNAIRGYLRYVGVVFNLTKVQREALTKIESMPEKDYPFNLNVKEHLMRIADPTEDYIVSAGVSFGLRVGDFIKITRGMLEPLIDEEPPIQLPEIVTKKEGVKAYPFIDRDAKEAIKRLLTIMDMERRTDPNELMLKFKNLRRAGREVNDILKELFKKAQIPLGEFRVRFHIFRKFLTDQLASVCAEDKWKHFVGKQTRTPYVSQEGKEAYTKVMEFTNINHKKIAIPDDVRKLEREISSLREQLIQRDKRLLEFEKDVQEIKEIQKDVRYLRKGDFVITYYDKFTMLGGRTGEVEDVANEAIDRKIEEFSKEIEKLKKLRKSRDYEVK